MMEQLSLFDDRAAVGPLASRLRPSGLEEFVGQKHLLGEGKVLRRIIDLLGTAGSGKDHAGQNYRQPDQGFLRGFFRRHKRNKGNKGSDGPGGAGPSYRSAYARICGRDPPL